MPFKRRAAVRYHIPRQKFRITNWRKDKAGLRNRGSLTVWFSNEAIAARKGMPSGKQGGQPRSSDMVDWLKAHAFEEGSHSAPGTYVIEKAFVER